MIARFLMVLCITDIYSLQIYMTLIALAAFIIPTLIIMVCYCFIIAVICRNDDDAQRERSNWTFERQESLLSNGMSRKFSHSIVHVRICKIFQMEWWGSGRNYNFVCPGEGRGLVFGYHNVNLMSLKLDPPSLNPHMI